VVFGSHLFLSLYSKVLIEQLLRNQAMAPPAHFNHLHRQTSGLADQLLIGRQPQDTLRLDVPGQHLSAREFEQLLLARQSLTSPSPFDQLIRQRQQEEQQQVPFCALPLSLPSICSVEGCDYLCFLCIFVLVCPSGPEHVTESAVYESLACKY
jgi:hypothetical protein